MVFSSFDSFSKNKQTKGKENPQFLFQYLGLCDERSE